MRFLKLLLLYRIPIFGTTILKALMFPVLKKIFLVVCVFLSMNTNAQYVKDFESWTNVGVNYPLTKKTNLSLKYILGLVDNSTRFERSMISAQFDHKINKWLKLGFEYRYAFQYDVDFHRFWLYATIKKGLSKRFDLSWRPLYQYDVEHFDREYMQYNPSWPVTRNMVSLSYKYNKKLSLYFYVDPYVKWKNQQPNFYRFRYGPGVNYLYQKNWHIGVEFVVIEEFNVTNPWSYSFVNLKCIYDLPKLKKILKGFNL